MDLKQEMRDLSYVLIEHHHVLIEHHLEKKFNISSNSMRSEGEQDLVFCSELLV